METPNISVIIPTYRDWSRLIFCLEALECQSYPRDRFEIIVVNNDPDDPVPIDITNKSIIVLSQPIKGSYAARNLGIKHSRANILAFTDSDCIPEKHWLRNAEKALVNGCERIAGRIKLVYKSNRLTLVEIFEQKFAFPQDKYAQFGFGATANMITYKHFFRKFGYFRCDLLSGGDYEWGIRVSSRNVSISYLSDVIVEHPARFSLKQIFQKNRRVIAGHVGIEAPELSLKEILKPLKSLMPPLNMILNPYVYKDLSFFDSFRVILLHWYLSIDRSFYRLFLTFVASRIKQ